MRLAAAALMAAVVGTADAHGQMNAPPSTRQGIAGKTWPGALSGQGAGGYCEQPASENLAVYSDIKYGITCSDPLAVGQP